MKKLAMYTLGCRVNQYETEAIAEAFIKLGYSLVDFDDYADVYVINTCTVTSISDKKSRKMIRKVKKINPTSVVAAVGCYAQVAPSEIAEIEGVDVIVGTSDKGAIAALVEKFLEDRQQIVHVENIMNLRKFEELEIDEYQDKKRAFLKVQDGCDRFCSYCLIPLARGPVRSRDPINIINEVEKLATNGFKEIILSGIHVASYGKDLDDISLIDIIEKIDKIDGIERIRIGSVEPMFFTEDIIKRLTNTIKFCPHFHLSLQSGCDETLKRMNRNYSTEEYKTTVNSIRDNFIDSSITTDIIVGFPGESDEEFNTTYKFLSELKLSKMHIFKFSPRKGTKAGLLKNQITPEIKESRSNRLLELDEINEFNFINLHIGRIMKVLFENSSNSTYTGYTNNYLRVEVTTPVDVSGRILDVKLTKGANGYAKGALVIK
jgi:threonylcarbamoyladenosine tRNA methylthiotransferase MtaB